MRSHTLLPNYAYSIALNVLETSTVTDAGLAERSVSLLLNKSDHVFLQVVFFLKQEMELLMKDMSIYYMIWSVTG